MRSPFVSAACTLVLLLVGACQTTETDVAHNVVSLTPPYSELPPAAPGTKIESGTRLALDSRQQEAVVAGVAKWMKEPRSSHFGPMAAARNSRGLITVCGDVSGRNGGGAYVGMTPYVGVLMGNRTTPEFVVVGIASSPRERAEVASICREAGAQG